jgi:arsenate reductase
MGAAIFNAIADPAIVHATSAGVDVAPAIDPVVVDAMGEMGIDLTGSVPMELTGRMLTDASFLVTMDGRVKCPIVSEGRRVDWEVPDPVGHSIERVRVIRDEIRGLVETLVHERGWALAD